MCTHQKLCDNILQQKKGVNKKELHLIQDAVDSAPKESSHAGVLRRILCSKHSLKQPAQVRG